MALALAQPPSPAAVRKLASQQLGALQATATPDKALAAAPRMSGAVMKRAGHLCGLIARWVGVFDALWPCNLQVVRLS
jgi:hypothetical protein